MSGMSTAIAGGWCLTKSVTPGSARATRRRAKQSVAVAPFQIMYERQRIPYWGLKGARVATGEN